MTALTLSRRWRACTLSVALGAAALGLASAAFAGEETTWYDKWPEIQTQLNAQAADPPPADAAHAAVAPMMADSPTPSRMSDGSPLRDPDPPVPAMSASPYDAPWFNRSPG